MDLPEWLPSHTVTGRSPKFGSHEWKASIHRGLVLLARDAILKVMVKHSKHKETRGKASAEVQYSLLQCSWGNVAEVINAGSKLGCIIQPQAYQEHFSDLYPELSKSQ